MPDDSLTLAKLQELYERIQRESPDRYELRVHSLFELTQALHATGTGTPISALEASGIRVYVVDIIPPWRAVLFNVTEWDRAEEEWTNRRISTEEWLRRGNACVSIIDIAEPRGAPRK